MGFASELRDFLPKPVPKIPSMKKGALAFLIFFVLGVLLYRWKRHIIFPEYEVRTRRLEIRDNFTMLALFVALTVCSYLVSVQVFNLDYYLRNRYLNKEWLVYQSYFPSLFS